MNLLEKIIENQDKMKVVKKIFYLSLAFFVLIDVFLMLGGFLHGHFKFENLAGFGALYGFISCALIIIVSKLLGHFFLMKKEDYYD